MTSDNKIVIDPSEVEAAFRDCLYRDEELDSQAKMPPEGTVVVQGIVNTFGFHPVRLEAKRPKVTMWLRALPKKFRQNVGDGWSFLNACNQENGRQWTGLHLRMEQLFCLAVGLKLAKCLMPRDMWSTLPGGMPYYVIFVED